MFFELKHAPKGATEATLGTLALASSLTKESVTALLDSDEVISGRLSFKVTRCCAYRVEN
ncbi:hypothetical protein NC651_015430 [Populus alba x Populus x berolinensis]|nr:hypothetical protein NC651_015430 [Populus alba x Populus x berolinensis]